MAFFFSSVAVLERKAKNKEPNDEDDEEDETEDLKSTKKKVYWPAISYWIAMQSPDGVQVSTVPVHSALLNTGMEITAKSLPGCKKGKEEYAVSPLCTTVKDHNNSFLQKKVDLSFEHCLEKLTAEILDEPVTSVQGRERVVRLQAVCPVFTLDLQRKAIPALIRAGLQFDVFGIQPLSSPEKQSVGKVLAASPVVVVLNKIERAMAKLGYALYKGEIYKKNVSAVFTFEHACTVKRVDYDLIEVADGWCFSISKREFVQNPIQDIGKESPRAFVEYNHAKNPEPKYFKEILQNSLTGDEIGHFCEYYLHLLNYGIKQHKEKVLCLIGEPNSGKTSLFAPISRIIPARYLFHTFLTFCPFSP